MSRKRLRMLLAENESSETSEIVNALFPDADGRLDLTLVSTMATLLPTVKLVDPEIILLDFALSPGDPLDAVHLLRRFAPGVPLVVIADCAQKQYAAQSLTEGAMAYLLKGYMDSRTLDRVVRGALERNTFEGLADLLRDATTGLYTRDGLLTMGSRAIEESQRLGTNLVLMCTLFENLRTLQEGFGPSFGDHSLRDLTALLAKSCRRSDLVARLGVAQFAILAIDADALTVSLLPNRLTKLVAEHNEARTPWGPIELRTSVGLWSARDERSFAEFLDAVESNLRCTPLHARAGGEITAREAAS